MQSTGQKKTFLILVLRTRINDRRKEQPTVLQEGCESFTSLLQPSDRYMFARIYIVLESWLQSTGQKILPYIFFKDKVRQQAQKNNVVSFRKVVKVPRHFYYQSVTLHLQGYFRPEITIMGNRNENPFLTLRTSKRTHIKCEG